jgi:cytochrome P450
VKRHPFRSSPSHIPWPQLAYLDACIKETLRLRPAGVVLIRTNEMPEGGLDVLGLSIPSGAKLAMFTFGLHRDPAYWERVDDFVPERFLPVSPGCSHIMKGRGAGEAVLLCCWGGCPAEGGLCGRTCVRLTASQVMM